MYLFMSRIDGTNTEGISRFLNDDNVRPNLYIKLMKIGTERYKRPVFISKRKIFSEEELTYNYGPNRNEYYWRYQTPSDPAG